MAVALKSVHMRFCLLWELGVSTGLRISDLLTLRPMDLNALNITFVESKTKNVRYLSLGLNLMCFLKAYVKLYGLKDTDFLFYSSNTKKNKPMSRQWAHRIIARTASQRLKFCIAPHSMRKTFACDFFKKNGSILAVQKELGHKHLSTTLIYLKDLLENQIPFIPIS
jgi:site-specific recombinase XerD